MFFSPSFVLRFHIFSTPKASAADPTLHAAVMPREWILIHFDSTLWGFALFVHKLFEAFCALCGSFWGLAPEDLRVLRNGMMQLSITEVFGVGC